MRSQQVLQSAHLVSSSFGQRPSTLKLDDEEGISCLANDDIFTGLANMGYEKIGLVLKPPPRMNSAKLWHHQSSVLPQTRSLTSPGDMSHHQDIYDNPSLSKKVSANMRRVGTGFSMVITPLFENILVPAAEEVRHVHKLEEENKILKEKSFKSAKIDTTAPVKDKQESFKQGRMIADMDEDVEDIDEEEPAKVEEVLEVVTAAKLMTEVVTTAAPTTTVAQVPKASAPRRRREELEALWKLVKERFETTELKNFSYDFLLNILKIMFEKPNIEANVWKDQKGRYGLAKLTRSTMQSSYNTTMPPPVAKGTRLQTSAKGKQPAKSSTAKGLTVLSEVVLTETEQMKLATKRSLTQTHISQASRSGVDEGTGLIPGVPDVPTYESDEEISWKLSDEDDDDDVQQSEHDEDIDDQNNDGDDFVHPKFFTHDEEAKDEESFDPIVQTPSQVENSNDKGNDDASHGMNVRGDEGPDAEDDDNELYGDVNINLKGIDSLFESTPRVDVPVTTTVEPLLMTAPTLPPPSIPTISQVQQAPALSPATAPSTSLQDLPNFAVSSIPGIVDRYLDQQMNEAVKVAVQLQSDKLRDEAQAENEDFLNKLDENIQKIIKEQVKEQVKVQVSKILPNIEKTVNEQREAEVLTRTSNSSKTSYVVVANLSELELKKILNEKMESNKSIHRSDQQKILYKALVDAYECDKIILDTYRDTVTLKSHRDNEDKDKEPFAGSDRGSKRRRAGKEPELTSAPKEKTSKTSGKSTEGSKSHQKTTSESAPAEEPMHITQDLEELALQEFKIGAIDDQPIIEASQHPEYWSNLYELMKGSCKSLVELKFFLEEVNKATTDQLDWNNPEGQQYMHDLLKPLQLIPNSRGRCLIPFDHFINNDLEYLCGGASSRKYTTSITKTKAADYGHIKWIEDLAPRTMESARDVYSKRRITAVIELKIVEWHNYKHLDTYRSDLKRKEAYIAYSNPRGFIYQNKDKQNRLMRIDELHKFSDDTLNDVQTALDDHLKGIRMNDEVLKLKNFKKDASKGFQVIKSRKTVFSIPTVLSWGGSIRPEGFWPSILLLVVIIVAVAFVVVVVLVVVAAIIGIVVVVFGVPSIIKLSFVITGSLRRATLYYLIHQPLGYVDGFL
nr:hypothetical protein [Tanacetum cinerariifolium]